ncbi:MAG: helix-hairpin-helix domain-containing protein [Bacteroidia bacterium]|nr:helix-hairpin-helix domain-containing protein [Bacteroidia bacterium]
MTKGEGNAFLLLLFLAAAFIAWPFRPTFNDKTDFKRFLAMIDSTNKARTIHSISNSFSEFNPNSCSSQDLINLGMKPFVANRVLNYRNKFGPFKSKSQLLKIYGIDTSWYKRIESYILLPDDAPLNQSMTQSPIHNEQIKLLVELNSADSFQLEKLPCIGMKLAKRIIAFRNRLGGFVNYNQLYEIYGLDSNCIPVLKKYLSLNPNLISRLDINSTDYETFSKHPYIGFSMAKLIVAYRSQHGMYKSIDDLMLIKAIDSVKINKAKPYLIVK